MNKATIFLTASWVGLVGLIVVIMSDWIPVDAIGRIAGILAILASFALLATRNADEYTRGLWSSGASLAFVALLLFYMGIPFIEGVYDGLVDNERRQDYPVTRAIGYAILAFYIGLFWKRLRGGM